MSDQLDVLISRYLDGAASAHDMRLLDERLRTAPEARRALFLSAAQDAHLREILAAEAAPEYGRFEFRTRRLVQVLAAAAAVMVVAGGLQLLLNRYPGPAISGPCRVVGGGALERGAVISTAARPGAVTLGGYCRVQMEPRSTLRVEGEKYAEQVFLERGSVVCEADRGVGKFTVRTDVGAVRVKGTKFKVKMQDKQGRDAMFDRQMLISVLVGTVLVTGAWGDATVHQGDAASMPPPGAALKDIVAQLDLPQADRKKLDHMLSLSGSVELRAAYRSELHHRLFDASRLKLQATMPQLMPKKIAPKVQAIRAKARAGGPPDAASIALIRLAVQKRAASVMMPLLHKTADRLADEAAADDRLLAWRLADKIRARLPAGQGAAFDQAVKEAGLTNREPEYIARAEAAIADGVAAYEPDLTGLLDPKTGKVTVNSEELSIPVRDAALAQRVAEELHGVLTGLGLSEKEMASVAPILAAPAIEAARLDYYSAVRARLFEVARKEQAELLPKKMPAIVQSKIMAFRTRGKAGGPPNAKDIARIQREVMGRTRVIMVDSLHSTTDAVAVNAVKDGKLVAAYMAGTIRKKLPPAKVEAFDAALVKSGINGDESQYLSEARQRVAATIESYEPDLTGIVDPAPGKGTSND